MGERTGTEDLPFRDRPLGIACQLYALTAFAAAQPLFDLLGRNGEFFVAHGSGFVDVVLFAFVLAGLVPLVPIALSWLSGAAFGGLTTGSALPSVGVLSLLIFLPIFSRMPDVHAALCVALAVGLAVAFSWAFWRRAGLRTLLLWLSPATILFPVWFLTLTPVSSLIHPADAVATGLIRPIRSTTPVVMIVFDEFPLASLVDEDDRIDRVRYPNFARLADSCSWYRNASTVAIDTTYSIPSILWGRRPDRIRLPTAADYPDNLIRFLGARGYGLEVVENQTSLCGDAGCLKEALPPAYLRQVELLSDAAVVYGHLVLPQRLAGGLPPVDASWSGFTVVGAWTQGKSWESRARRRNDPQSAFERLLSAIRTGARSTFYFAHINLPHMPWKYLPSGREYGPPNLPLVPHGTERGVWTRDEWESVQGYQRHLLQVGLADRLVGSLIDTLEDEGMYDDALVVIVADHGISIRPGETRRGLSDTNLGDIVNIPLLVKFPGQTDGMVSDDNVQTIDIVPTVAAVLAVDLPWVPDGKSLLTDSERDEEKKTRVSNKNRLGRLAVFMTAELKPARMKTVARRVAWFGREGGPRSLFRIGPRSEELYGKRVEDLLGAGDPQVVVDLEVVLDQPGQWTRVDRSGSFLPVHVTGRLLGPGARAGRPLAVAVNEVVRSTTWSYRAQGGKARFSAMLPETDLIYGANRLEVLLLADGEGGATRLRQPGTRIYSLVRDGASEFLETSSGQRLPIVQSRLDAKSRIVSSALGGSIRGFVRAKSARELPETLVVTLAGRPLFSAPFTAVLTGKAKRVGKRKFFRFAVRIPEHAVAEQDRLRLHWIVGEEGMELPLWPNPG